MKNIKLILLTLLSCLLLQGCSKEKTAARPIYPVTIAEVKQGDAADYIDAIGNVGTLTYVQIRPQVTGNLIEYYVKQGDFVKKDDPILLIDPRAYEFALKKAEGNLLKDQASLKYSEQQVERNKALVTEEYVSKLNFAQYESQVDLNKGLIVSDEADIATAKLNLEWTKPTSPIEGMVSAQYVNIGNLVLANSATVLIDIRQVDPADIQVSIPQNAYVKVIQAKKPLKFLATLPQKPNEPREGEIYFIDNHLDTSTGTILLKGGIPNKDRFFLPGEFVYVKIILDIRKNALLVPDQAVKVGQEGYYLYVYKPDTSTVEYRKVVKGPSSNGWVVIESGINSGEKVIVKGQNNLLPGTKVKVVTEKNDQKGHS